MSILLLCALTAGIHAAYGTFIADFTETRNCQSATYYYGVVLTFLTCPPSPEVAMITNSLNCWKSEIVDLCKEGTDERWYRCDPMVDIYRAADYWNPNISKEDDKGENMTRYLRDVRFPVQWLMEGQENPAYYYKLRESRVQYVYKVEESYDEPNSACANLVAKISDRDSYGADVWTKADDWTRPAHIWNRERFVTRQALTGWNPTKLPLPGENGVKIGQFFIYSKLYPTLNSRVLVDVRYLVRYESVHIVSMNPKTKKNVTLRHAVYHKDDIEEDALNTLKRVNADIRPDGVKVGTHKLVCYIKFYNWLRELYNRPCNTTSTLYPTYGPWGPTYSIERTDW